jgi:hypothetical protein
MGKQKGTCGLDNPAGKSLMNTILKVARTANAFNRPKKINPLAPAEVATPVKQA